ncbi:MAG: proline--tRNA ligase [Acidobacteria bacterium]|jgi:prolyl-tRNA synthetase|nr:MAG: proline--tRNA ligase [Acidobacteriales bacterium 13_2_20CM_2_55_5]OLD19612.1 MAG: proline--tRNA ligase [Acidobacteriales bacterium 13_1_40CM_3_55_5]PYX02484.1 MAG: proline--tRNA ligase [Acidobacteriota bacterium]PYX16254.1 MAG: proline--tRNA ligase [Acidobacteriota bacterium]
MHRWSQLFIPTLREAPADAEVASHKFLVRAGYIRQLAAGIYSYLFLGQRSFNKIIGIVREEMDKIGQEFYLPALHPRELWESSGRWSVMGDTMFRLKDRKGADLCLGMTEEEVMTEIARKELRSYKQLPQIWYQIQSKFRDEARPKSGLLRVRQFLMKDSYSFDIDAAGLDVSYQKHYDAYCRIFDRCGLKYVVVEAHSGAMGGSQSHEFMVRTPAGEDQIVSCEKCDYAANMEKATSKLAPAEDLTATGNGKPLEVHTPGQKTIEDVARFLGVSPKNKIKTLALMFEEKDSKTGKAVLRPVIVLLRGDHQLNEAKLSSAVDGKQTRPMQAEEIEPLFKSPAGFLGPIGIEWARDAEQLERPILLVDQALEGRTNLISGANREDYHLKNVTPGRDFQPTAYADLRSVGAGENCPNCGAPLRIDTAVEIGHIFKLGYKYSESMGARVLDRNGKEVTPIMGSYGIGIERILTAAIEQSNDENGFWLPPSIAPFEIVVTPTNVGDEKLKSVAENIVQQLEAAGFEVLLDDRDERPGVKFKDADLVGIPYRVTVGKKVTEGTVEVVQRSTREMHDASIGAITGYFEKILRPAR